MVYKVPLGDFKALIVEGVPRKETKNSEKGGGAGKEKRQKRKKTKYGGW